MDNEKLVIGGAVLIVLVLAIPILAPMLSSEGKYDAVADSHKMQQMNDAVAAYARDHQQYPPTLYHLVPDYMDEIPVTSTRRLFEYDPRTGVIVNPSAPPASHAKSLDGTQRQRNRGGGGVSPATDAMTGLGVSQELNY